MIETIVYKHGKYPSFQAMGHAAQFSIPFAKHVCKGKGYDIGCMKKEWAFPESTPIDLSFDDEWHATNLPESGVDYIFSSHCLEHIDDWVETMNYWYDTLKSGGTLFLYLPDYSQEYWRPWNNRKHRNMFSPQIIKDYMEDKGYRNVFVSGVDLNNSFMIMGEK
jgi:predicted SAM-dependent methyltransferase